MGYQPITYMALLKMIMEVFGLILKNGISKFDGYQFKNYSTLDGLNGNDGNSNDEGFFGGFVCQFI